MLLAAVWWCHVEIPLLSPPLTQIQHPCCCSCCRCCCDHALRQWHLCVCVCVCRYACLCKCVHDNDNAHTLHTCANTHIHTHTHTPHTHTSSSSVAALVLCQQPTTTAAPSACQTGPDCRVVQPFRGRVCNFTVRVYCVLT
jgi:hypothetical protein